MQKEIKTKKLKGYEKIKLQDWIDDFIQNNKKNYSINEEGIQEAAIDGFIAGVEAVAGCIDNLLDKVDKKPLSKEEQLEECFFRR